MAMFAKTQEDAAERVWEKVQKQLAPKDGMTHVLMINSFSKFINQYFGVESKYTTQIDTILVELQKAGYQVLDVKFNSIQGQGLAGNMEGFHTLITYRSKIPIKKTRTTGDFQAPKEELERILNEK